MTGGGEIAVGRITRRGRYTADVVVPSVRAGRHVITLKAGRVALKFPFTVKAPRRGSGVKGGRPRKAADPLVVAVGDIACDPSDRDFHGGRGDATHCRQMHTSNIAMRPLPSAVLAVGDLQYEDGAFDKFTAAYDPSWGRLKALTRPVVGNHEYLTPGASGYFDYFNGFGNLTGPAGSRYTGYYSFDVGAWHLIALNSNCSKSGGCGPNSPQERWLRADLAAHRTSCTIAYWHHPRFASGRYSDSSTYWAFWKALYDYGAEIVINGHDHNYQRYAPQDPDGNATALGIREFIVGTGGKERNPVQPGPIKNRDAASADSFGVLKLTLHQTGYGWKFASGGGSFSDGGTGACH
jgi:hypothetical protein